MKKLLISLSLLSPSLYAADSTPVPDLGLSQSGQHIVINIPQTRLFLFKNASLVKVHQIAVGKESTRTPIGEYKITGIAKNPTWHVPLSIQAEMRKSGKSVLTTVPPGPKNPLGPVFMRVGPPGMGIGIHGTSAPSSVPGIRSHGCIRMKSPEALALSSLIQTGIPVSLIYQPVILNKDDAGQIWLTSFTDVYKKQGDITSKLTAALSKISTQSKLNINHNLVKQTLAKHQGKPVCISCSSAASASIAGKLNAISWLPKASIAPSPVIATETDTNTDSNLQDDDTIEVNINPEVIDATD